MKDLALDEVWDISDISNITFKENSHEDLP